MLALLYDQLKSLLSGGKAEPDPKADMLEADDPLERAARAAGCVSVTRQGFSYLIDVSYTSDNPSRAAAVANGFAEEYLVDQLESRYQSTRRTNEWLSERLGDLRNKVRESERAVEIFRAENNIVGAEGSTLSDQEVSKLNGQLILARAETAQAKATYDQVKAAANRGADLSSFADAMQAAAIGAMRAKASEIRRELSEATVKYGGRHPTVVAMKAQLADVNRQVNNETARTVASAENKYRVAASREQSIEASLDGSRVMSTSPTRRRSRFVNSSARRRPTRYSTRASSPSSRRQARRAPSRPRRPASSSRPRFRALPVRRRSPALRSSGLLPDWHLVRGLPSSSSSLIAASTRPSRWRRCWACP